jgi:hypothetical protein
MKLQALLSADFYGTSDRSGISEPVLKFSEENYANRCSLFSSLDLCFAYSAQTAGVMEDRDRLYLPVSLSAVILPGRVFSGGLSFYTGPVLKYHKRDAHHLKVNTGRYAACRDNAGGGNISYGPARNFFSRRQIDYPPVSIARGENLPRNLAALPPPAGPVIKGIMR